MMQAVAVTGELVEQPALVRGGEQLWVRETATGLCFDPETPLDVWAGLVTRLIVGRQRISFALADAINFGRECYGEDYAQWVDETGLQETTLMNVAWVGRQVPISRRREAVDFTYHQAVAALEPEVQDKLLDEAVERGWKRFELRAAVRQHEESQRGRAVDANGEPVCAADSEPLVWVPQVDDLTPEVRRSVEAQAPAGRHRLGWIAGALWMLVYQGHDEAFLPGRWRA